MQENAVPAQTSIDRFGHLVYDATGDNDFVTFFEHESLETRIHAFGAYLSQYTMTAKAVYAIVPFAKPFLFAILNKLGFAYYQDALDENDVVIGQKWLLRNQSAVPHKGINTHAGRVITGKYDENGHLNVLLVPAPSGKVYTFPGGTQDKGESFAVTAKREILQEVGLDLQLEKFFSVTTIERVRTLNKQGNSEGTDTSVYFGFLLEKDSPLTVDTSEIDHILWLDLDSSDFSEFKQIGNHTRMMLQRYREIVTAKLQTYLSFENDFTFYYPEGHPEKKNWEPKMACMSS